MGRHGAVLAEWVRFLLSSWFFKSEMAAGFWQEVGKLKCWFASGVQAQDMLTTP